jgi:hypothetical protein
VKAVILQPSYVPWRGFFHQIQKADVFVFYDDVQYDKRGWRNRNRVKTAEGTRWITIPVLSRGSRTEKTLIRDMQICWDRPWNRSHWALIQHAYGKAPYFERYAPLLESFYSRRPELLADFTIELTIALAGQLGLENKRFLRSSSLEAEGTKDDRLISLMRAIGARHYISGPSARAYIDEQKLCAAGLTLEYMVYDYPEYEQLHSGYDPELSIIDLLFMKGPESPQYIWPGTPPHRSTE